MRISDWSSDVCSSDLHGFEGVQWRRRDAEALRPALRQRATEFLAALAQVAHLGAVFGRAVERQFFELRIVDRDVEAVAEFLQAVDIDFLGVVGDVLRLTSTGAVTLDGRSEEHTSELQSLMRI